MVQNWPREAPQASDMDFRTKIVKAKLIPNKKWILETQSEPSWTMLVPEMARTCPSGAPPVQDIDFGTNIVKASLIIIKMDARSSVYNISDHISDGIWPEMAQTYHGMTPSPQLANMLYGWPLKQY